MKKITLLLTLIFVLSACSKPSSDSQTVRVGIVGSDSDAWNYVVEKAKEEGIDVEIVTFSDYPQPNQALASKEIDMNAFQHHVYLDKEVETHKYPIVAVADTFIAPMGIYSKKIQSIQEVPDGAIVSIPNDVTNGSRALQLLESEGLLELADTNFPQVSDITANPKNLDIKQLQAANIPSTLEDVSFAIINSGIAVNAGFSPENDAVVLESIASTDGNPYVNLIAVRTEDKDNDTYRKVIDLYRSDAVKEIVAKETKGSSIPVW